MRGKDWKIFLKRHNGPKHSHHSLLIWLIRDMHTSKATASVKISRKEQMTIDKLVSGPSSSKIRRNGGPQVFGPFSAWFYRLLKHIPRYGTNRSFFAFLLCIIIDKMTNSQLGVGYKKASIPLSDIVVVDHLVPNRTAWKLSNCISSCSGK